MYFHVKAWDGWHLEKPLKNESPAPLLLKRRISSLGKTALLGAWNIPEAEKARYILSSRHGEFSRTLTILESYLETKIVSPADFSLSVHHALIGLLSIVRKNHKGHTALAAGHESFCLAMIEAYALLKEAPDEPVLLVHCDEPLMGSFEEFNDASEQPVALILLLTSADGERLSLERVIGLASSALSCHALDFLNFLDQPEEKTMRSIGKTAIWNWSRNA